ncbi:DUF2637 domain-containing protein [Streptomyces sp. NPDC004266]|uniref:DUF2637 domain-containing protein n=1 Tax=Streptomyces sp. NPDC004266 TaxID=3364693 RepID=UPI00368667E4
METYPPRLNGHAHPAAPPTTDSAPHTGAGAPPAPGTGETARMHDLKTPATIPAPSGPAEASHAPAPATEKAAPPVSESAPPREETAPPAPRAWSVRAMRGVILASALCAAVVAAIGFIGSYDALRGLAEDHGFAWYSWIFPVGIDAGIVAMYGLDLVMVWRRMPKPMLRMVAHLLTAATIVFNAASGTKPILVDPLGALMHGVLPLLFVAVVEAVRHLIIRTNRLVLGVESDQVPLHRWILSPFAAWGIYRRMKLRGITSYNRVVEMDKELDVYEAWLKHKHGRGWKKRADATALLPFTMARYGMSVDDSLDLPRKQQEADDARAAAEAERIAAAAAGEEQRALDAEERDADAKVRRMRIGAKVETAEHLIAAETSAAEAEARAAEAAAKAGAKVAEATAAAEADTAAHHARIAAEAAKREAERSAEAAERIAAREEEAQKTAAEAEAEARALAAKRQAKADDLAIAEAEAETARKLEEARRRHAEAFRLEKEQAAAEARREAELAEFAARKAAAEQQEAEATAAAALARAEAARAELAALEAEDIARLSPRERAERKVARMILTAHTALPADQRPQAPDMYAITLEQVMDALGVSQTIAGQRRQAAADLIAGGYTG